MAEPSSSPPSSPPRRARPRPLDPPPGVSSAAFAAKLAVGATSADIRASLAALRLRRDELSSALHESAPPWHDLAPAVSSLHSALSATQSASHLRNSLASIPTSSNDDYATRLSTVLRRSTHLSANLSVLAAAREFLTLSTTALSINPSSEEVSSPSSAPRPPSTPASPHLPPGFLAQAVALRRALSAAAVPALANISALDRPRADLAARHAALLTDLEGALVHAVFTGSLSEGTGRDTSRDDISVSTRTLPSTSPAGSPLPSPPPRPVLHSDLIRSTDTLAGKGHAARVLASAAGGSLSAAIRDAIVAECAPPSRTVASLASSSFTAGPATSVHSAASGTQSRSAQIFGKDVSATNRAVCETVFERVKFQMTGVLRRLSSLANSVADEETGMEGAIRVVWQVMERLLVFFVQALLGSPPSSSVPKSSNLVDGVREGQPAIGLSLLPSLKRKVVGSDQPRTYAWALEQSPNYHDSFVALMNNMPALSTSIYNLEVIFSPLQQFIVTSGRLLHSLQDQDKGVPLAGIGSANVEREELTLPAFLGRIVDVFVKAVRQDVKSYMDTAFGNRAGTLLQPPSTTPRGSQIANASSYVLPALPQTQILLDVIGSCLSLCVAVPNVARPLGEVINSEVIKPFSERAMYALNLAESWTDAGPLLTKIRVAAHPSDESQNVDSNAEKVKSLKNGMNGTKSRKWNTKAQRTIRKHPDLTTTGLARIYDKTNHLGKSKAVRLLDDSEWNAVVRLVANAKIVITELENCTSREEEWTPNGVASQSSAHSQESISILKLRGALGDRGTSAACHRAVIEAIGRTRNGCRMLREEVIERGIAVLHTEVVLRCFSEVIHTLIGDGSRPVTARKIGETNDRLNDVSSDDARANGTGLSKPSSIFKASTLQLSDVERSSEDTSVAVCEYDEFGDRITGASDNVTDVEIEDYGFPNSLALEQNDWKSQREGSVRSAPDDMLFSTQTQALTDTDRAVIARGREFGGELRLKDEWIKWNLSVREREFIFCQADGGVAAGIRVSGEIKGKGDRDLASASRLFLDAAGTAAAETFGWPVVESNYSVAEGASESGGECRTLLYAAGLL